MKNVCLKAWILSALLLCLVPGTATRAQTSDGDLYINHRYKFSIVKPDGWLILDDYEGTTILFLNQETNMSVNVVAEDVKVDSLEDYVKLNVDHLDKEGISLMSRESDDDAKRPRTRVLFGYDNEGEDLIIVTDYYALDGRGFHVTTSYAESEKESDRKAVEDTLDSFRIL